MSTYDSTAPHSLWLAVMYTYIEGRQVKLPELSRQALLDSQALEVDSLGIALAAGRG